MRAVVQRVRSARVSVGDRVAGEIGRGLLVLLGVGRDDAEDDVRYVAGKIRDMRVFPGEGGKPMDRSVAEVGGSVLVVSQFTLYGDMRGAATVVRRRGAARDRAHAVRSARERIARGRSDGVDR
jgi:D-tyrosyl-tRNA(Tyr) deacylase